MVSGKMQKEEIEISREKFKNYFGKTEKIRQIS